MISTNSQIIENKGFVIVWNSLQKRKKKECENEGITLNVAENK
jgi:hypothetical protein